MKDERFEKADKIWKENEEIAELLARCYYQSILDEYGKHTKTMKKDPENFGFNTFVDGIRVGLDIALPMVDEKMRKAIKEKIGLMIGKRMSENIKSIKGA